MNSGCAAAWGALGALKNNLPSEQLLLSLSAAAGAEEFNPLISSSLSFSPQETSDPLELETALIRRYAASLHCIEKFMHPQYRILFRWLLLEFDFFNTRCAAKMILLPDKKMNAGLLMYQQPVSAYPPPSDIRSFEDLARFYSKTLLAETVKDAAAYCAAEKDIYLFESLCEAGYLRILHHTARSFPETEQRPLLIHVKKTSNELIRRASDITASDADTAKIIIKYISSTLNEMPEDLPSGYSAYPKIPARRDIFSPAWYFYFFLKQRDAIRLICRYRQQYGELQ